MRYSPSRRIWRDNSFKENKKTANKQDFLDEYKMERLLLLVGVQVAAVFQLSVGALSLPTFQSLFYTLPLMRMQT